MFEKELELIKEIAQWSEYDEWDKVAEIELGLSQAKAELNRLIEENERLKPKAEIGEAISYLEKERLWVDMGYMRDFFTEETILEILKIYREQKEGDKIE